MKLVSSEQMQKLDRMTIDKFSISGEELMENAGQAIAERILNNFIEPDSKSRVIIFCGKGNNGGDGLVIARYLHIAKCNVVVYIVSSKEKLSPEAKLNFVKAEKEKIEINEINSVDSITDIQQADIIIDALFGTGFSGEPRGISAEIIELINNKKNSSAIVVSVDLPSGLNADGQKTKTATAKNVIAANYTYTLGLPKFGLFVSPGRETAGIVKTVPIGIPEEAVASFDLKTNLIDYKQVSSLLPFRKPAGHKGDFGRLFILAGSTGLTGAAILTAKASLRSGLGLAKIGCPKSTQSLIASNVIEATSVALPDAGKKGKLALRGLGEILKHASTSDALVIGPGLGEHHETKELVKRLIPRLNKPALLDADALNAIDSSVDILKNSAVGLVLTPHPGEFKRLAKLKVYPTYIYEIIELAVGFASENKITLVLKGSPTVIADSGGNVYLNPTGNNGMATGGSGDVLSGIIGTFLSQGLSPVDASICGVYIHGFAGDLAAGDMTARSMIASDIIDYLPDTFRQFENQ